MSVNAFVKEYLDNKEDLFTAYHELQSDEMNRAEQQWSKRLRNMQRGIDKRHVNQGQNEALQKGDFIGSTDSSQDSPIYSFVDKASHESFEYQEEQMAKTVGTFLDSLRIKDARKLVDQSLEPKLSERSDDEINSFRDKLRDLKTKEEKRKTIEPLSDFHNKQLKSKYESLDQIGHRFTTIYDLETIISSPRLQYELMSEEYIDFLKTNPNEKTKEYSPEEEYKQRRDFEQSQKLSSHFKEYETYKDTMTKNQEKITDYDKGEYGINYTHSDYSQDPSVITKSKIDKIAKMAEFAANRNNNGQEGLMNQMSEKDFNNLKKVIKKFMADHPIDPNEFKEYPGSSKGPKPEDNPEHF